MKIRRAEERGQSNHGWLEARHSFSFGEYHDPAWMGYRSLRVINEDRISPGMGFGTHPHRDMEIITYILEGALEHKDSMGNGRVIQAGEFQYMAAGTGVQHSEFNPSRENSTHLLQIWIHPERLGLNPSYAEKSARDFPSGSLSLVASREGREGSMRINQDAELWLAKLESGQSVPHTLAAGRHAWLQVAEGKVTVNDQPLKAGDAASIAGASRLEICADETAKFLLFDLS